MLVWKTCWRWMKSWREPVKRSTKSNMLEVRENSNKTRSFSIICKHHLMCGGCHVSTFLFNHSHRLQLFLHHQYRCHVYTKPKNTLFQQHHLNICSFVCRLLTLFYIISFQSTHLFFYYRIRVFDVTRRFIFVFYDLIFFLLSFHLPPPFRFT